MNHFSTFSQRPSPQAPWHPSKKMLQITAMRLDKVSSRYDQMAPQLCPFEISKKSFKASPSLEFSDFDFPLFVLNAKKRGV